MRCGLVCVREQIEFEGFDPVLVNSEPSGKILSLRKSACFDVS